MTPEEVLEPLLKKYSAPRSLVEIVFVLLIREAETGYRTTTPYPEDDATPAFKCGIALDWVFSRLPKEAQDFRPGLLASPVRDLVNLPVDEMVRLHDLRIPWHYVFNRQFELKDKIRQKERQIADEEASEWSPKGHLSSLRRDLKRLNDKHNEIVQPITSAADECKGKDADWVFTRCVSGIWRTLYNFNLSFTIPSKLRAQHTHVMGAAGSGKTQLLSRLILQDIQNDAAVIVMTLKGSLIPTLSRLQCIQPDRLVHFSKDNPLPVNLFDIGSGDSDSVIELINNVFSSDVLDAETTAKQTALLTYCIRLLYKKESSTLWTLRQVLKEKKLPEEYQPALKQLSKVAQEFFKDEFPDYAATKKELMWRLDALFGNTFVEKLLSEPKTVLNIPEVMSKGQVLLVDTSVEHWGEHGSSFLGKFILALITVAAQQRKDTSRPVYVYLDEAHNYFTTNIATILERCREANVCLTIAHQQLSQLGSLEPSVMTNTATKMIGRCSSDDARRMANVLSVPAEILQQQPDMTFRVAAHGLFQSAVRVSIKPGYVESQPTRPDKRRIENIPAQEAHSTSTAIAEPPSSAQPAGSDEPIAW